MGAFSLFSRFSLPLPPPSSCTTQIFQLLPKLDFKPLKCRPRWTSLSPRLMPREPNSKPKLDKVSEMAQKLGIPMTPDIMQLGNNEAISNALVEIAVGMGKSEGEISAALTD